MSSVIPGGRAGSGALRFAGACAALLGILAGACDPDDPDTASSLDDDAAGVLVSRATYHLDWIWGDAVALDGGGWAVTTDLGYEVAIEQAWLTTYSVALVPCPEPVADDGAMATLSRWLLPTAYAGHSGETDPSAFEQTFMEDFTDPEAIELGTVSFDEADYCRVHLLSASARDEAIGTAPAEALGTTLRLVGRVRAPGSDAWGELHVETSLANGTFLELPELPDPSPTDGAIDVVVHRRLDTLLHGIELDIADPTEVEQQVLRNLMHDATLDASAAAP